MRRFIQRCLNGFGYSIHKMATVNAMATACTDGAMRISELEAEVRRMDDEVKAHVRRARGEGYGKWAHTVFGVHIPVPGVQVATSLPGHTPWGVKFHLALVEVELEYVDTLLREINESGVEGTIAEFGIYEGWWINHLFERSEAVGLDRPVIGFDSFAGLSAPHPQFDNPFWQTGMYSASRSAVEAKLRTEERPRIKLIEGFFADSLVREDALGIAKVAFARIDCDIYEPALDCLRYLAPRLSHRAILVFDDWPHQIDIGETRAFAEWVPTVPHLRFEFLFFGSWGHFYIRVLHRDQETR